MASKAQQGRELARIDYEVDQVPDWIREVIDTSLAIEREDARVAGSLGFMTRALVSATMPYKDPKAKVYERHNGDLSLSMLSPKGVPYGKYPRLLLSWLVTEAVTKRSNVIVLGDTLADFLRNVVGVEASGGKTGTATRVSEQMERLFTSMVSVERRNNKPEDRSFAFENITLVRRGRIDRADMARLDNLSAIDLTPNSIAAVAPDGSELWKNRPDGNVGRWDSEVELTEQFFRECLETPVPLDLRAYRVLGGAPMAMDIYAWISYRASYIKKATRPIPWESLQAQFGSGSPFTEQGTRDFKKAFKRNLEVVRLVYPGLRVDESSNNSGLILQPGPSHIPKLGPGAGSATQRKLF